MLFSVAMGAICILYDLHTDNMLSVFHTILFPYYTRNYFSFSSVENMFYLPNNGLSMRSIAPKPILLE